MWWLAEPWSSPPAESMCSLAWSNSWAVKLAVIWLLSILEAKFPLCPPECLRFPFHLDLTATPMLVFSQPLAAWDGGGGCKRSTMLSEPAASCFHLFCVGTWLTACQLHCSQTCMSDVHKSTAALDHAGCRCAFEAPNWNSQVFSSSHTGLSFKHTHTHTHTHTSSARSTAVCASVRAGIVKCVLRVLVWSGIMLICPWWRHSHQRLHTIVRRDGQRGRKGRSQGVEKTSGREVNLW